MEDKILKKRIIKISIISIILVLIIAVVSLLILKYQVEGELNMPFKLNKIMIVSTAEGYQEEETQNRWEVDIYQNNDIYIDITKNKNFKEVEVIESVVLDNFIIDEMPEIGEIVIYRPYGENQKIYEYADDYKIDNSITYSGSTETNVKNLQIANQGGILLFRISNKTGKKYISNEDELKHDGTLLRKIELSRKQIEFKISFDLTINLKSGVSFKANIIFNMPVGDIINEGTSSIERTNIKDIVFKRV